MNHCSDASSDQILEKIDKEFSRFRIEVGGHYSKPLKSMAVSAFGMGISRRSIAKAVGVSTTTIGNWVAKTPKARQLKVIASPEVVAVARTSPSRELICIRLISGVEIDVPKAAFDVEFVEMLSSVRDRR